VAASAYAPHVGKADTDWLLDLYFGPSDEETKFEVSWLVIALPPDAARKRLVAMLRDADPINRKYAVRAIGGMAYRDRRQLVLPLQDDPAASVRAIARTVINRG
jgi:hypothetical protein